jgi:hypothetical protein
MRIRAKELHRKWKRNEERHKLKVREQRQEQPAPSPPKKK